MLVSLAWLGPALLGFITQLGEAHIFGEPMNLAAAFFYSADWLLYALLTPACLTSLKAQLNPHFLFNALNTIAVLMREGDSAGATRVMEQLSDVLRLTLSRNNENEVTVEDELELVREYLEVERARFSD